MQVGWRRPIIRWVTRRCRRHLASPGELLLVLGELLLVLGELLLVLGESLLVLGESLAETAE